MTRREFALGALAGAGAIAQPRLPNIVVVLCDDLGYGDVGCNNPESPIATPQIDRLAAQGMRFTDAHSPSAVCTPTRYGLMTGRYCWRSKLKSGVLNGYSPALIEPGRETIASLLKKKGYRTGGFGKWHLGLGTEPKLDYASEFRPSPNDHGFDEYFGIPASLDMPPYVFFQNRRAVEQPTSTIGDNGEVKRGPFWRGGPIAPGFRMEDVLPRITENACRFIAASAGKPFFTYVPLNAPHTPWVPSTGFQGRSKANLYGDFVQQVDASIGQILAQLDKSKVSSNTLVIVTSDNGAPWEKRDSDEAAGHWADRPWRGQKADIQEGGHRIPFLARWPGVVKPGSTSSQTICLTDIFATAADVTSTTMTDSMGEDSYSLASILRGTTTGPVREAVVHHSAQGLFSIRQGKWKLILGRGSGGFTAPVKIEPRKNEPIGELYDLETDPHEDRNLYIDQPDTVARLSDLLSRYQRQGYSRRLRG